MLTSPIKKGGQPILLTYVYLHVQELLITVTKVFFNTVLEGIRTRSCQNDASKMKVVK
jgi:hypothetical protein